MDDDTENRMSIKPHYRAMILPLPNGDGHHRAKVQARSRRFNESITRGMEPNPNPLLACQDLLRHIDSESISPTLKYKSLLRSLVRRCLGLLPERDCD